MSYNLTIFQIIIGLKLRRCVRVCDISEIAVKTLGKLIQIFSSKPNMFTNFKKFSISTETTTTRNVRELRYYPYSNMFLPIGKQFANAKHLLIFCTSWFSNTNICFKLCTIYFFLNSSPYREFHPQYNI
jgi:hypothetical protein